MTNMQDKKGNISQNFQGYLVHSRIISDNNYLTKIYNNISKGKRKSLN